MSRKPRIHYPGAFYHVILRGNNKQPIFFSDNDRYKFLEFLKEAKERSAFLVHGFCLMDNHVHLVVQVSDIPISVVVQNFSFRYTKYVNWNEGKTGHLFQGRFHAILVEDGSYFLELIRYVHLNPVRAGIVVSPENYYWSGHCAVLGQEDFSWCTTDLVLKKFDADLNIARQCYQQFISNKNLSEIEISQFENGLHNSGFLGSNEFVKHFASNEQGDSEVDLNFPKNYSLNEVIVHVCETLKISPSILKLSGKQREGTKARGFAAYFVKRMPNLTMKELAEFVGKESSCLGKLASDLELKALKDQEIASQIEHLQTIFLNS